MPSGAPHRVKTKKGGQRHGTRKSPRKRVETWARAESREAEERQRSRGAKQSSNVQRSEAGKRQDTTDVEPGRHREGQVKKKRREGQDAVKHDAGCEGTH